MCLRVGVRATRTRSFRGGIIIIHVHNEGRLLCVHRPMAVSPRRVVHCVRLHLCQQHQWTSNETAETFHNNTTLPVVSTGSAVGNE